MGKGRSGENHMRVISKPRMVGKATLVLTLQACMVLALEVPMSASTGETQAAHNKEALAMVSAEAPMVNGASFIDKMKSAADSYDSYYFEYKMTAFKHGTVVEEGKFWFKKPHLIRLEETGQFKHGCVALLTPSGKVKAHAGGALSLLTVDLSPESGYLRSANGYPMVKSDLTSLAEALQQFLAEGKTSKVTEAPVQINSQSEKVFILDVYQQPANQIYKRVAVDSKSTLPVEWWDFESGKLVSHSIWKTFKGNVALSDRLFEDTSRK